MRLDEIRPSPPDSAQPAVSGEFRRPSLGFSRGLAQPGQDRDPGRVTPLRGTWPLREVRTQPLGQRPSPAGSPSHRAPPLGQANPGETLCRAELTPRLNPHRPRPARPLPIGPSDALRPSPEKAELPPPATQDRAPSPRAGLVFLQAAATVTLPSADRSPSPCPIGPRRPAPPARARLRLRLRPQLPPRFTRTGSREPVPPPPSRRPSQESPRRLKGEAAT